MKVRLVAFAILFCSLSSVHAQTIAGWTFESSLPNGTTTAGVPFGPILPEIGAGQSFTLHASASVVSNPAGNGSAESFSSNTWAVGDYYQFSASTVGFSNIQLQFDQTSSSTGPAEFSVSYTTDGTSYTPFAPYTVLINGAPNPPWNNTTSSPIYTTTVDFSSIAGLNNNLNAGFRLINTSTLATGGGVVAAGGTSRMDNVFITVVPEPTSISLLGFAVVGLAARRWRRKK